MKQWYAHLVEVESVIVELDKMDLSKDEKLQLAHLIDSSLYHTILDTVLSQLQKEDKKSFLMHLKSGDHDKIWAFLNSRVENIAMQIRKAVDDLREKLHKDIKESA